MAQVYFFSPILSFRIDRLNLQGYLWSQIPQSPSFQSSAFPYPLLVADSRPSNFDVTGDTDPRMPPNATVYEVSRPAGSYSRDNS
jgi:hypothetical protein